MNEQILKELSGIIDCQFKNLQILEDAITHSSYYKKNYRKTKATDNNYIKNNQRLEFFGDRVLGLAIAKILFDRFPNDHEGELAKRFNNLVDRHTCANVAKDIFLQKFIQTGPSIKNEKINDKILADAIEALIAAIFIDQGQKIAFLFVEKKWQKYIQELQYDIKIDPKTRLQEYCHKIGINTPKYSTKQIKGEKHKPIITVSAFVDKYNEIFQAEGKSKKQAEQNVANKILQFIQNETSPK